MPIWVRKTGVSRWPKIDMKDIPCHLLNPVCVHVPLLVRLGSFLRRTKPFMGRRSLLITYMSLLLLGKHVLEWTGSWISLVPGEGWVWRTGGGRRRWTNFHSHQKKRTPHLIDDWVLDSGAGGNGMDCNRRKAVHSSHYYFHRQPAAPNFGNITNDQCLPPLCFFWPTFPLVRLPTSHLTGYFILDKLLG